MGNHTEHFRGIVERLQRGDETAFKELYDRLSDRLFAYVVVRASAREEALDLMQDIFLALWASRTRLEYRSDGEFYGFVFTIARRTLAEHYGRRAKDAKAAELPYDDRYDMDTDALGDVHMIERLLPKLSDAERELVTLRYWSGLSFAEIGAALGKEETAVRVAHHRALTKLRSLLNDHDA